MTCEVNTGSHTKLKNAGYFIVSLFFNPANSVNIVRKQSTYSPMFTDTSFIKPYLLIYSPERMRKIEKKTARREINIERLKKRKKEKKKERKKERNLN